MDTLPGAPGRPVPQVYCASSRWSSASNRSRWACRHRSIGGRGAKFPASLRIDEILE